MAQKRIFLMGPQGSGKGTQAQRLATALDIPALSMGQLLRDEGASGSELGEEILRIINAGNLVSDEVAAKTLQKRLAQPDTEIGYIIDGYPRNAAQYNVAKTFIEPTHVVVIEVPQEESLKRLTGRLTCDTDGQVYSVSQGSKEGDKCDCGGTLVVRDDDTPEAIEQRLKIYHEDTEPIIADYEQKGLVHRIDGMGGVEEVHQRIMEAIS